MGVCNGEAAVRTATEKYGGFTKINLLSILILVLAGATPAPPTKAPFTLVLTMENPTVTLGSDARVKVQWTNTSDKALDSSANILDATNVDPNFLFELLDDSGRPVPKKVYKFPQTSGHAEFGKLKPGETITHDVNLLRLFDLKHSGKYTLQVSRRVPEALGGGTIKSNIVTIILT
jgi:hypothetical protein